MDQPHTYSPKCKVWHITFPHFSRGNSGLHQTFVAGVGNTVPHPPQHARSPVRRPPIILNTNRRPWQQ